MMRAVRSVLAVLVAMLLLCSMALAVGGGVAGAGGAAAGSITGQTAASSKPQPAETNQPSAAVAESPTEAGSEDASDDGETSNGGIFAKIAEFFQTLLEPRRDSGEMVEKTFGEIRDAINFGFNTVENTLRDSGNFPFIDGSAVVGAIANVMLPIGLLVFLICWSLQVMRSGLELELYEVKHFIKMGMEFIAAGANQDTKRFCINFLASYILLSLQLVVMTVVYAMFRTSFAAYLASAASITTFSWKGFFTGGIFMIIYAVIMVKSDRLFDKVLH